MKKKFRLIGVIALLAVIGFSIMACGGGNTDDWSDIVYDESVTRLAPYTDIRGKAWVINSRPVGYRESQYNPDDIITFTFNEKTVLIGSKDIQKRVMENGKNPGLGVRSLHSQGITGKGVNVAIIDQNLALTHPEYAKKIAAYNDVGTNQAQNSGSMHGPAVASLLVGDQCGTAPGARLYYAAAPSWTGDSAYQAAALRWVISENEKLPKGKKIRVVSVSAAPSGPGTPFTKNTEQWDKAVAEAQAAGILVLDCRQNDKTGLIARAYYDLNNPDDITLIKPGSPSSGPGTNNKGCIYTPSSRRSVAEEYFAGAPSWTYWGIGGRSWTIPYAAGVLAMGWQVNPNLGNDEIVDLLFKTAYVNAGGFQFINPPAFIEAVKATVK